ncbi:hypothetical protein SPOG_01738 [Schizosaccharomyces cryophilus OY26]|uniref:Uncharacterized protein n=1 Tax=Schizosaccharomyces cryophilus (strain OY26 / ATCC MYA-4695 / CBS 11777 / NBRC 106824 / NRRL Y48691) TaxID=653667 RepID=S9VXV0_SCHCR|nr:uncharacterized protein SPOG_01738 [Schizosaccharomyces cryophilus OY26]EPY52413.1 hypothetical protein SPOG_01738 [Schizosaccharomyces cryophilus OY26]
MASSTRISPYENGRMLLLKRGKKATKVCYAGIGLTFLFLGFLYSISTNGASASSFVLWSIYCSLIFAIHLTLVYFLHFNSIPASEVPSVEEYQTLDTYASGIRTPPVCSPPRYAHYSKDPYS